MAEYVKKPQIFFKRGMNVTQPGDRLGQEWTQYLQNLRCYRVGEWRQRPGLSNVGNVTGSVYYMSRLNDNQNNTFRRFIGTSSGSIWIDDVTHTSFSNIDSGYLGKQYSSIVSRPDRSPSPYLFVANSGRNSKFDTSGNRTNWGLAAPITAPIVDDWGVSYKAVVPNDSASYFSFIPSAGITVTAFEPFAPGANQTQAILYDSGSSGMASIVLGGTSIATAAVITLPGTLVTLVDFLTFTPVYTSIIQDVRTAIANTTIDSIEYESGTTGACTIKLAQSSDDIQRDTIILLTNGGTTEYVRVLSVTKDLTGMPYIRCSTTNNFVAGNSVQGRLSIRLWVEGNPVIPGNGATTGTYFSCVGLAYNTTVIAGLHSATFDYGVTTNYSTSDTNNGGLEANRLIQDDDFFHVNILADYDAISEIQFQFDVGDGSFTENYYYISIRPSDLQGSIAQTQPSIDAQQLQVQRDQLDQFVAQNNSPSSLLPSIGEEVGDFFPLPYTDPSNTPVATTSDQGPVSVAAKTGGAQWTEFFIPISQFQRVGSSNTTWKDVQQFRVTTNFQGSSGTGFAMNSIWIGGTYGPNSYNILPYQYVYRARNTDTGARSNPSPPNRYQTNSSRQLINIAVPTYPDPQADVIDIFRIGGTLSQYYLVGTILSSETSFQDTIPDLMAIRSPLLEFNKFKPWVSSDSPKSGICNVLGTRVTRQSGDLFNTQWVRGTQILIDGQVYNLYTNPSSTDVLEITDAAGDLTNVTFQIPEPVLDSQTFPAVFGPYSGASGEFNFVVGDPRNPGYLYWTNGNDVESTSDVNAIELCPPSETLMNGIILDGIIFVFSDRGSWRILPSFEGGQTGAGSIFYPQKTAMGKGLIARWGVCVGDAIYFVSNDGIYKSRGDAIDSLTDDALAPLFRRDIAELVLTVPIAAISFDPADIDDISLTYSMDGLYFTYKGIDGLRYTLYYSFLTQGWTLDSVTNDEIIRTLREVQYPQEDQISVGTSNGVVMLRDSSIFLDNSQPISCRFLDREEIWDDLRSTKQVGDTMIDADPQGAAITPTMRFDNNASSEALTALTGIGRTQYVRDVNSGLGRTVRGAALDLTWSDGTVGAPRLYAWEPAALIKPEESVNRATDWDNGNYGGSKWLQGFRLRGDTSGVAKAFEVQIDGGTTVEGFTFTANGEQIQQFWLDTPVVCHEMRLVGTDGDLWRNMGIEWIFEPEPELAAVWETQVTSFGLPFYMHMREAMIAYRSNTDVSMFVITDGTTNTYTLPNSNGERVRSYLPVQAIKAKYHKFRFEAEQPFALWIEDIECKVGAWGRVEAYTTQRPFGDISRTNGGARI